MTNKYYDICVVGGLGHVGLPLGIVFANAGKNVVLYDVNQNAIDTVSKGKMPFLEEGAEEVLGKVLGKTLSISSDRRVISNSHFVIIVIGTPIDDHLNPNYTLFKEFFSSIIDLIRDDQHIILRSTVFPGTTEKVREYLAEKGIKAKLSFCPERIAEGKAMKELYSLPQIVSAFDDEALKEARDLFTSLTSDIIALDPIEAEIAKLFNNTWRYLQFAIANYFYQITTQNGLDFYRIFNAITYNYPRAKDFPNPGFAAGPCLFKDTMQLAAYSNNSFFMGHAAMLVNEGLPNFVVQKLKEEYPLSEKVVGVLGMAFKANNDDKRESLSYKLKRLLEMEARKVLCSDVYIQEEGFVSAEKLIAESDIVILATPHRDYAKLKVNTGKVLVDIWNFYGQGGKF